MAQEVITLAKEETSQDILTRVKTIETKVNQIQPAVAETKNGYPYVKWTSFSGGTGTEGKIITISGKARVTVSGSTTQFFMSITIDGVICGADTYNTNTNFTIGAVCDFYCENSMKLKFYRGGSSGYTIVIAQFASSSGTIS